MKRLLTILSTLAIIMEMMAGTHSYADRSVLSNGHFVKIKIAETGFYMISYDGVLCCLIILHQRNSKELQNYPG